MRGRLSGPGRSNTASFNLSTCRHRQTRGRRERWRPLINVVCPIKRGGGGAAAGVTRRIPPVSPSASPRPLTPRSPQTSAQTLVCGRGRGSVSAGSVRILSTAGLVVVVCCCCYSLGGCRITGVHKANTPKGKTLNFNAAFSLCLCARREFSPRIRRHGGIPEGRQLKLGRLLTERRSTCRELTRGACRGVSGCCRPGRKCSNSLTCLGNLASSG